MTMTILEDAARCVHTYNERCVHYNLIAEGVYAARRRIEDPFSLKYQPYIIAGLIGFDMRRTMGDHNPYATAQGFGLHLLDCLRSLKGDLRRLADQKMATANLSEISPVIEHAYTHLATHCGVRGSFHVGTTKVLHWLYPDLFIVLDFNSAMAFQEHHKVEFRRTTQPGYSAKKYLECIETAQAEIVRYGPERFADLEANTPVCRIFDKVAFVVGAGWFVSHRE
jgi:hypothetical protein